MCTRSLFLAYWRNAQKAVAELEPLPGVQVARIALRTPKPEDAKEKLVRNLARVKPSPTVRQMADAGAAVATQSSFVRGPGETAKVAVVGSRAGLEQRLAQGFLALAHGDLILVGDGAYAIGEYPVYCYHGDGTLHTPADNTVGCEITSGIADPVGFYEPALQRWLPAPEYKKWRRSAPTRVCWKMRPLGAENRGSPIEKTWSYATRRWSALAASAEPDGAPGETEGATSHALQCVCSQEPVHDKEGASNKKGEASLCVDPQEFDRVVAKLRAFFREKGFTEAHTQNRLSILAACEDPFTVATFSYAGQTWPLPQTGQMWLEYELLKNPRAAGFYTLSTSYRNEPNPVPGRHDLIFPMFEFEMHGGLDALIELEKELLEFLGYGDRARYGEHRYCDLAAKYGVAALEHEHEAQMCAEFGPVNFLTEFPETTDPFWNMKRTRDGTHARKVDVILSGQETIGAAERETDREVMRSRFASISGGKYASSLYAHFTRARVDRELEDFLAFEFFPRSGGGIGVTRLIRSMKREGLL